MLYDNFNDKYRLSYILCTGAVGDWSNGNF